MASERLTSRRYILLLDPRFHVERDILRVIKAAPDGEGAPFVRALLLIGYSELKSDKSRRSFLLQEEVNEA